MEKILFTSKEIEVTCNTEDLNRECIIYRFTFPNGKSYIGQTWHPLEIRIKDHIYSAFNKNKSEFNLKKSRAIRKYKKFKVDVLFQGFCLNEQEIYFIEYFDTMKSGYNSCRGGEGKSGFHLSDETKKKISEKRLGTHLSEKTKEMMSKQKLGVNNPKSKAIFMLNKNTQEIIRKFEAIADAMRYILGENLTPEEIGKRRSNIGRCLQHPTHTAFGYKWRYVDENP